MEYIPALLNIFGRLNPIVNSNFKKAILAAASNFIAIILILKNILFNNGEVLFDFLA